MAYDASNQDERLKSLLIILSLIINWAEQCQPEGLIVVRTRSVWPRMHLPVFVQELFPGSLFSWTAAETRSTQDANNTNTQ